jgi:hypothetical protein
LVVRELPDETLVYDLRANKAHCLNRAAALVWRLCDGRTDVAQLAAALRDELGVPDGQAAARLALWQLSRRGLLEQPVEAAAPAERIGRREALRKLALLGALPIVLTVTARHASAATSICSLNDGCFHGVVQKGKCVPTFPVGAGAECGRRGSGMVCDGKGECGFPETPTLPPVTGPSPPPGGGNGVDCTKQPDGTPCGGGKLCCSGACTDVTTDASNCGACGVFCQSGKCQSGKCA